MVRLLLILLLLPSLAPAATYTFSSPSLKIQGPVAEFRPDDGDGPVLTVSALWSQGAALVKTMGGGISVRSPTDPRPGMLTSLLGGETLVFDFFQTVRVLSLTFRNIDSNDDIDLWVNDIWQGTMLLPQRTLGLGLDGVTSLKIGALPDADGTVDDLRLVSMEVSPVPLPPAGLLLAAALGLGLLLRRRAA